MSDQATPTNDTLYAVIPAYNEAENLAALVNEWAPVIAATGPAARLVVIDDGSKDDTFKLLEELREDHGDVLVPLTKTNSGHGATLLYGYRYALEHGAEYIFQTDSDRQTVPEEFSAFWDLRGTADAVIGWRSSRQDGFSRLIVTKVLKAVVRLVFRVSVPDANCPFRLIRAQALEQALTTIPPAHNLANVLLTVRLVQQHRGIRWVKITFRPRQGGVNSINIPKIIGIGRRALRDFWGLRRLRQG
ncbi:MAG: glycosyltransferase family 2 protein [Bifidobacteriaceae bacterium]|jgi:glycosyltransferase involved in cell wall biosynthesis|nr:glycosyltransferase family 2 protein [Bifidobacteriaceae bacterium]